ncbi:gpW family head-tail joining protein [Paracoccus sp. (in: a-proteobacteria)]|uniref:gpW family head-tail joining protein n=1 Tax=Paracoccus sp. TaxID=267 RepID=UPI0026DEB21B|nr:gpW family head-tail joining protein [Paracoccus sp. (in: a-proteobacteria)]MDO5646312.1 gpW family head-tail joining protein [Paracoccus sp. (in: a-proteobacteria)]
MEIIVTPKMLEDALQAYHRIMTGGGVYEFRDQNGEVVRYSRVDLPKLWAYITWLQGQLAPECRQTAGPMRVWL